MPAQTTTATIITMPQLGESVTEGMVGNWLKEVGERVEKYDPLCEVTTDKVNSEIPSPVAGVLVEILVEPETTVPVGTGICRIDESSAVTDRRTDGQTPGVEAGGGKQETEIGTPDGASVGAVREPPGAGITDEMELLRARSSPVVRRIAEEHGIAIGDVIGTGIGGRVTKRDILAYLESGLAAPREPLEMPAEAVPVAFAPEPVSASIPSVRLSAAPSARPEPGDDVIPLTAMRRAIAEHMVRSARTAPHVTCVVEVDMTNVVAFRAARKEEFARREGIELTYLPFAIKAVTIALRDHPRLNAVWDEERIIHRGAINIGVAVGLEDGLVVPVIKHADRLSLAGLMHAVSELAGKARAGSLTPDDVAGGTFTVNNPGTFGTILSTPILVQPQVAILATEAIVKRPVVIDDMIAIRSTMNLSLSFDHRALDGLAAARFLQQVKAWLERVDELVSLY
jgi:2-oxoisovalerate dehydrogenase E2 component (dihydrolipoyl transacylase)